jgi:integrase
VDYDFISRNPTRRAERPELPERKHVKPSELDLMRLMRAINDEPLKALVWIALGGGFRRGEVAGLQWEDVAIFAPDHGVIRAHRRRNRLGTRAQERLGLPSDLRREGLKRQAERSVDIGSLVIAMLEQHWQAQLADRQLAVEGGTWKGLDYDPEVRSGYLFTSPIGTPLDVDAISAFMATVRERAGLDIQRFHALRRVFATLMNKTGVPDRVIMDQGGWADLDMAHYYQDPMASQKKAAAQALDVELQRLFAEAMGTP